MTSVRESSMRAMSGGRAASFDDQDEFVFVRCVADIYSMTGAGFDLDLEELRPDAIELP